MLKLGQESTVDALNRTWTLSPLTVEMIEQCRDWVANRIGDPFELLDRYIATAPPVVVEKMMEEAKAIRDQLKGFSLACPIAKQYLFGTESGGVFLYSLLLKKHHPTITSNEVLAILAESGAKAQEALIKAQGAAPVFVAPSGNATAPAA